MSRPEQEAMDYVISFRVSRDEKQQLKSMVEASGLNLSAYLRERLNLPVVRHDPPTTAGMYP